MTNGKKVKNYVELTFDELERLDRRNTVFLISVSPIEVHGYHLPVGTDVFISEKLLEGYVSLLNDRYPHLTLVKLPPLYAGSDALPLAGSLSVSAKYLQGILFDYGKGLAKQGFRYLFVADNHGGPRHQMATEAASRKLWRKYKFYLLDSFNSDFRKMVQHDEDFLQRTALKPGVCGDDADSHAGTNETSLMLATNPEMVKDSYISKEASSLSDRKTGVAKSVEKVGQFFMKIGSKELGKDLLHLSNTLARVTDPDMKPYMGDPKKATKEAGEAMINARLEDAMELFDQALRGEVIKQRPLLWGLRFLRHFPE